jgi:hypothetical protein
MKSNRKSVGRRYLVAKLQEDQGLSRRDAVEVVNAILEWMVDQLRRGKTVEFPFGELKRVKRYFSKWWAEMDDWPANRSPYMIVYDTDGGRDPGPEVFERQKRVRARSSIAILPINPDRSPERSCALWPRGGGLQLHGTECEIVGYSECMMRLTRIIGGRL